jgi:uncharacterized surface protein with fasciclin (FAS1) repeats
MLPSASSLWLWTVAALFVWNGQDILVNSQKFETSIAKPALADPDSKGYRYCAYWKLADGSRLWTDCDPYAQQRCGRPMEFEYRCCPQFETVQPNVFPMNPSGTRKCARVVPQWDTCPNVLESTVGQLSFANHLKFGDFIQDKPSTTVTIFAPYTSNQKELDDVFGKYKDRQASNPILHHVVKGRIAARDLKDGMVLETMFGTKLKVTKYTNGITCVECAELIDSDIECKNGLIHTIRKPLLAPKGLTTGRENLYEALSNDPRTKAFANDIPPALAAELRQLDSGTWFTVLAPLEEEWLKTRVEYPDPEVRAKIVQNHIFRKMLCSSALTGFTTGLKTALGESVSVQCETEPDTDGQAGDKAAGSKVKEARFVRAASRSRRKMVATDIPAGNGVMHIIDGPIIPTAAKTFSQVLKDADALNFKKFADYIKNCDLRMESGKKYAVLMPMDYAFEWWSKYQQFKPEYDRFMNDEEYRCRVARYHIAAFNEPLAGIANLWHEQKGYPSNTKDTRYEVDYFMKDKYRSDMNFHYSPIVNFEAVNFTGGSMYRLQRINVIPEKYLVDVLKERANLRETYGKVEVANMDKAVFKPNQPLNLFLATRNEGWKDAKGDWREEYSYPNGTINKLLMLHSVGLYLWGGDIGYFKPNSVHRFMSRQGIELTFWMDGSGVMRIGHANMTDRNSWPKVVEWNLHAIDGIIWVLDGLLVCPKSICPVEDIEYELYEVYAVGCISRAYGPSKTDYTEQFRKRPFEVGSVQTDNCVWFKTEPVKVRQLDTANKHNKKP